MESKLKWQKELNIFNDIKTSYIVEGNVYDIYPYEGYGEKTFCSLDEYLFEFLRKNGYENIIFFDPMHGFYNRFEKVNISNRLKNCGCDVTALKVKTDNYLGDVYYFDSGEAGDPSELLKQAAEMIETSMTSNQLFAFIMLFSSRYCKSPDDLISDERFSFLNLMYGSLNAHKVFENNSLKKSAVYMVAEKMNDIPSWFFINNPFFKSISIPLPDSDLRSEFIEYIYDDFCCISSDENKTEVIKKLAHITEGMKCVEINGLANLCDKQQFGIGAIDDAASLYKYGIKENPWESIPREILNSAEDLIRKRVKGQDAAITRVVDVIKRAASGMSGLQHSSAKARPRGIMFFAGPTGVGKTEMAKSIAELLFGDEANCIRFDMSEYAQAQADQKLFGAPPGYVGYEAGGQLTNAVRNKPFSILLFDEIEKADPSIWDKFLQILDDGRMTDGQGNTVYFSETIIVFTSNLGIYLNDGMGRKIKNVSPDDTYEDLENKVMFGIKEYFNSQQGKPEILNRIGNNIIVFQYITKDSAHQILLKQLNDVKTYMSGEKNISLDFTDIEDHLLCVAMDNIENGGRGIGNIVEEYIINPLSRIIYDFEDSSKKRITIHGFEKKNGVVKLNYQVD